MNENNNNNNGQGNNNNNKNNNRMPIYAFIVFALIALFVTSLIYTRTGSSSKEEISYTQFVNLVDSDQVKEAEFED